MKHLMVAAILALLFPSVASGDDLDDARTICNQIGHHINVENPRLPQYAHGWEHCGKIERAWKDREIARRDQDESANPDLKKTRDAASKLPN